MAVLLGSTRASLVALPLVVALVPAGCGGATTASPASTEVTNAGSAEFYVQSNVPAPGCPTGASFSRSVTFTRAGEGGCAVTSHATSVGPCSLNPCVAPPPPDSGTPTLVNAGAITIDGAQMPSLTLTPCGDGVYASDVINEQLPWTVGGASVTFQWAHVPGDPTSPGGSATLATPPYIALAPGSAFATRPTTVARDADITVAWTSDTPPTAADQVAVDLDVGSSQLVCIFAASAGTGVIPAAAVALVPAGAGSYNVHSKQGSATKAVGGTGWQFGFNVDAQARTNYGLAKGSVTFE